MKTLKQILEGSQIRSDFQIFESQSSTILEADLNSSSPNASIVMIAEGPGNLSQRHYYGKDLLNDPKTISMMEGKQSFLNHPSRSEMHDRPERSVEKLSGWFSDVHPITRPVTESGLPGMPVGYERTFVVGKLNAESGNAVSMNKLREASNYQKKYPDKAGYVGWSILGGGTSKPKTIDGEEWNNVEAFTGIDSIDMVTRAGAGGRLISLMEGQPRMFRSLFGKPKVPATGATAEKARLNLAVHIVTALKESGTTPSSAQVQTIEEGIKLLDHQLMTPAFIRTLIHEADIDLADDKELVLIEKLDVDGKLKTLREAVADAKNDNDDDDAKEAQKKKEAAEKKIKDDAAEAARLATESAKDGPAKDALIQQLTERAVRAELENETLKKNSDHATRQVREVNARTLMAKTTLTAPKQAIFLESIAELPVENQADAVVKLEEAFGEGTNVSGAPARNSSTRSSTSGVRFAVDATR